MKRDYYEVLGVARGATAKVIKSRYFELAKHLHPDANGGTDAAKRNFQELGEAYGVLKDPQKRAAYDKYGHAAFDQNYRQPEPEPAPPPPPEPKPAAGRFFSMLGDMFSKVFPDGPGFFDHVAEETTKSQQSPPPKPPTLDEAIVGFNRSVLPEEISKYGDILLNDLEKHPASASFLFLQELKPRNIYAAEELKVILFRQDPELFIKVMLPFYIKAFNEAAHDGLAQLDMDLRHMAAYKPALADTLPPHLNCRQLYKAVGLRTQLLNMNADFFISATFNGFCRAFNGAQTEQDILGYGDVLLSFAQQKPSLGRSILTSLKPYQVSKCHGLKDKLSNFYESSRPKARGSLGAAINRHRTPAANEV